MDLKKTAEALNENGFEAFVTDTAAQAVEKAFSLIPEGSSVGFGGSMTLEETGFIKKLRSSTSYKVLDRDSAKDSAERVQIMRQCLTADFFVTSFNGISETGVAVNIDGNGNRVAAITFGPKNVIVLAGKNKITSTEEEALLRARNTAAPKNAVRFGKKPEEADSLCNIIQTLRRGGNGRIKVILFNEEAGY